MRIFFALISILFISCGKKIHTVEYLKSAEDTRVELMRKESDVYGDFFKLRVFHSDLMQVTTSPDRAPYPELDSLFQLLRRTADAAILPRLQYDSSYKKITALNEKGQLKRKTEANASAILELDSLRENAPSIQKTNSEEYFKLRKKYEDLKSAYGILRLSMPQMALRTNDKLTLWLDSLEEIGRMTAREKQDLRVRFPSQKGADFFKAYQPVSMLEAKMKEVESMIAQLQNSQSRFEESNKEDYVYYGPFIRMQIEIQATDNIISALALLMQECRDLEKVYWKQY